MIVLCIVILDNGIGLLQQTSLDFYVFNAQLGGNGMMVSRHLANQGCVWPSMFRKRDVIFSRAMSSEPVTSLQHFTVPPLAQTLNKFLHSVKPLLSSDQYQHASKVNISSIMVF